MKKAFITGINGQDGSYLAEHLIKQGYEVHGLVRRNSVAKNQSYRINHLYDQVTLHYGDITDYSCLHRIIYNIEPDEIYNLAAQSHVKVSEETPIYTAHADALGVLNLLEILCSVNIKFYQASTSEMFGNSIDADGYQRETTPMNPVSPYAAAKLYAHNICKHYRQAYKLWIGCGILFNHTSLRRGETFVEKKIIDGFAEFLKTGKKLELGNMDARRDIGYAPEYVETMPMIMNHNDDFVIATGQTYSVYEICEMACEIFNVNNVYDVVIPSVKYKRAQELDVLKGDASKAKQVLGWEAKKSLRETLEIMAEKEDVFNI